ncbi:BofC C-terminal domain-containing protein [Microbacteriaceae bacterium 4G12]
MKLKVWVLRMVVVSCFCFLFASPAFSYHKQHVGQAGADITVILQRVYVDEEVSEEIFKENVVRLEEMLQKYKDWQLVDRDDVQIVLQKRIQDISPLLKTSGYFGVSKEGVLQIFKGVPNKENAIHSFFQIDTRKMETRQRERLERGIRVKSKERYMEVLNEMKNYSVQKD